MLGGLWYSKTMFLKPWAKASGFDDIEAMAKLQRHPAKVFGISFVLAAVSALVFAWWLGPNPALGNRAMADRRRVPYRAVRDFRGDPGALALDLVCGQPLPYILHPAWVYNVGHRSQAASDRVLPVIFVRHCAAVDFTGQVAGLFGHRPRPGNATDRSLPAASATSRLTPVTPSLPRVNRTPLPAPIPTFTPAPRAAMRGPVECIAETALV